MDRLFKKRNNKITFLQRDIHIRLIVKDNHTGQELEQPDIHTFDSESFRLNIVFVISLEAKKGSVPRSLLQGTLQIFETYKKFDHSSGS